jgi:hypothetical protein
MIAAVHESAIGPKRTSLVALHMPTFGGNADIAKYISAESSLSSSRCKAGTTTIWSQNDQDNALLELAWVATGRSPSRWSELGPLVYGVYWAASFFY